MKPAELNYEIYDKELLAIFEAFQQWCNYLKGSTHMVLVLSDHKNLEHLQPPSSSPTIKSDGPNTFWDSTTSFGIAQDALGLNPTLSPDETMYTLRVTSVDLTRN